MPRVKKPWTRKGTYGSKEFVGSYENDKDGERVFVLRNGRHKKTYDSPYEAQQSGWRQKK